MYVVVKFSCFSKCGYEGGNAQATSVCNTTVILHLSSRVEKLDVPGKERNCQTVTGWRRSMWMLNIIVMFTYMSDMLSYRLLLAAIHYNENADRPQVTTAAGEPRSMIRFPKWKKGGYSIQMYGNYSPHCFSSRYYSNVITACICHLFFKAMSTNSWSYCSRM